MPKNKKKGKNSKNKRDGEETEQKLRLKVPDSEEEYGLVTAKCGSGRFVVKLNDEHGTEALGRLCGKFRKGRNKRQNWVDIGTVVMVGMRAFENREDGKVKVEIIHVYNDQEARKLRKLEEFNVESRRVQVAEENAEQEDDDCAFDFDDI